MTLGTGNTLEVDYDAVILAARDLQIDQRLLITDKSRLLSTVHLEEMVKKIKAWRKFTVYYSIASIDENTRLITFTRIR